ncbi:uncharacterized protein Dvar_22770 [Desulfosarcina variabilis str. Montpellier]
MGTSKKAVLEKAILLYAEKIESEMRIDVLEHTSGCWKRDEDTAETVRSIKKAMRHSQEVAVSLPSTPNTTPCRK